MVRSPQILRKRGRIIKTALKELNDECENRGVELSNLAGGYRFQSRQELSPWISRLWDEKPPRYTRALLETLAIIAYQQPVSRGDIEQIRGVAVSPNIMRTLIDREWVQSLGHREVPKETDAVRDDAFVLGLFRRQKIVRLTTTGGDKTVG